MDLPVEIRAAVEGMDSTTYNHSVRTWRFARMIEAYFCLGDDKLSDAAYVHDIGKLFIPERILDKHEGLTRLEREIMGLHPYYGYQILGEYGMCEEVKRMVLYHHGMNPVVLKPLAAYPCAAVADRAKMLHTIDAFEALTTDRPYRRRMSVRQAADFLEGQEGYHREVLDCLKRCAADFEGVPGQEKG